MDGIERFPCKIRILPEHRFRLEKFLTISLLGFFQRIIFTLNQFMKIIILFTLTCLLVCSHSKGQTQATPSKRKVPYDSALARKLGADAYGMKQYVIAFLKTGKVKIQDSTKRAELQMAHLRNIIRLSNEGKLLLAGPFMDKESPRGIYIFNVTTLEEARKLTETDPAIQAGTLEMELRPWYGSAAVMELLRIHHSIEKVSVAD